ncbi:TPA: SpoV family signaling peptide [Streptococcus pyogenes]
MKNKLFLVALATVTVLGPSLATPHHQTVHAAEQALAGTCTYSNENPYVDVCFERKDGMPIEENIITKNNDFSLLNWFWEIVTNWWSKITGYFS